MSGGSTLGFSTLSPPRHTPGDGLVFLFNVLSPREAASYLGVSEDAVLADAEAGRLPGQRVGGDWRFLRFALVEWLYHGARAPVAGCAEAILNAPIPDETPEEQEAFLQRLRELRKQNGPVGGADDNP
ncbi:helix-turn-helix domain-containing protein [bacterium]|nr:helix-turn-helix domain-containing protein [bacterium]